MKREFFVALATALFICSPSFSGTFNFLGYGAQNQGLGNSTVALPTDAYSQAYNPALMGFQPQHLFSMGVQGAVTSFNDINQVIVNTPSLGGVSSITVGNVNTSTRDNFLYTIAFQTPLYKAEHPLHFGFTVVAPVQRLLLIDTPNDFAPQYSMYTSDTQRLVPSAGFAMQVTDDVAIGAAGEIYIVQGTSTQQNLPSGGNSNAVMSTDVRTGVAPNVGVAWKANDRFRMGASWKGKKDYRSQINITANIGILGPNPLNFNNTSSLSYDPDMFLLGASYDDGDRNTYLAAIKYEAWGGFNGGAVAMSFSGAFAPSFNQTLPSTPFHDIYTDHIGYQHRYQNGVIRAGYAYVPTPVPDPNTSQYSNILDSDKHELFAGWGYKWEHFFLDGVLNLDLVGFVEYLVPKNVVKNDSQAIGYPGYKIGGTIFGYGLTLTREY